jgi:hypothetical protein
MDQRGQTTFDCMPLDHNRVGKGRLKQPLTACHWIIIELGRVDLNNLYIGYDEPTICFF